MSILACELKNNQTIGTKKSPQIRGKRGNVKVVEVSFSGKTALQIEAFAIKKGIPYTVAVRRICKNFFARPKIAAKFKVAASVPSQKTIPEVF